MPTLSYINLGAPAIPHWQDLTVPTEFDWTPPVQVSRSFDGDYTTDYDTSPFLVEGGPDVTTYYVDADTGDNANPGTALLPKKTLLSVSNITRLPNLLIKARGTFYSYGADLRIGHDNICVEAWGGAPLIFTPQRDPATPLVWTDEGGGVWSMLPPTASFNTIAPYLGTDIETLVKYTLAANLAACLATPGTFFRDLTSGIKQYVHTLDGSSPASGHTIFAANARAQDLDCSTRAYDQRIAFHGVTFMGGSSALIFTGNTAYTKLLELVNCRTAHSSTSAAMYGLGAGTIISYGCTFGPSDFDGASYHAASGAVPNALEINCTGRDNGKVGTANQGSTTHEGGKIVRVNCVYSNNQHQQVADVNTGSQSWNPGCTFGPKRAGGDPENAFSFGGDKAWLDGCVFVGVDYEVNVNSSSALYYRNMAAPVPGPSSTGTITGY